MSQQNDLLREAAAATSSGAPDRIKPALPMGHEGARRMREAGRQMRAGLKTPINVEILDMVEEGDPVAVRWQLTATYDDGRLYERSIMAIYRFENGRIAEECRSRHSGLEALAASSCGKRESVRFRTPLDYDGFA